MNNEITFLIQQNKKSLIKKIKQLIKEDKKSYAFAPLHFKDISNVYINQLTLYIKYIKNPNLLNNIDRYKLNNFKNFILKLSE